MAKFTYSNVEIKGLAVSVPKMVFDNRKDNPYFSETEIENIIRKTGIEKRRIASKDVCSSDLCFRLLTIYLKKWQLIGVLLMY